MPVIDKKTLTKLPRTNIQIYKLNNKNLITEEEANKWFEEEEAKELKKESVN